MLTRGSVLSVCVCVCVLSIKQILATPRSTCRQVRPRFFAGLMTRVHFVSARRHVIILRFLSLTIADSPCQAFTHTALRWVSGPAPNLTYKWYVASYNSNIFGISNAVTAKKMNVWKNTKMWALCVHSHAVHCNAHMYVTNVFECAACVSYLDGIRTQNAC